MGDDRFDFRPGDGSDIIADFTDGVDLIGLLDGLTFADVTLTQVGDDTQMTATGSVVTLQVVDVGTIDSADFAVVKIDRRDTFSLAMFRRSYFRNLTEATGQTARLEQKRGSASPSVRMAISIE